MKFQPLIFITIVSILLLISQPLTGFETGVMVQNDRLSQNDKKLEITSINENTEHQSIVKSSSEIQTDNYPIMNYHLTSIPGLDVEINWTILDLDDNTNFDVVIFNISVSYSTSQFTSIGVKFTPQMKLDLGDPTWKENPLTQLSFAGNFSSDFELASPFNAYFQIKVDITGPNGSPTYDTFTTSPELFEPFYEIINSNNLLDQDIDGFEDTIHISSSVTETGLDNYFDWVMTNIAYNYSIYEKIGENYQYLESVIDIGQRLQRRTLSENNKFISELFWNSQDTGTFKINITLITYWDNVDEYQEVIDSKEYEFTVSDFGLDLLDMDNSYLEDWDGDLSADTFRINLTLNYDKINVSSNLVNDNNPFDLKFDERTNPELLMLLNVSYYNTTTMMYEPYTIERKYLPAMHPNLGVYNITHFFHANISGMFTFNVSIFRTTLNQGVYFDSDLYTPFEFQQFVYDHPIIAYESAHTLDRHDLHQHLAQNHFIEMQTDGFNRGIEVSFTPSFTQSTNDHDIVSYESENSFYIKTSLYRFDGNKVTLVETNLVGDIYSKTDPSVDYSGLESLFQIDNDGYYFIENEIYNNLTLIDVWSSAIFFMFHDISISVSEISYDLYDLDFDSVNDTISISYNYIFSETLGLDLIFQYVLYLTDPDTGSITQVENNKIYTDFAEYNSGTYHFHHNLTVPEEGQYSVELAFFAIYGGVEDFIAYDFLSINGNLTILNFQEPILTPVEDFSLGYNQIGSITWEMPQGSGGSTYEIYENSVLATEGIIDGSSFSYIFSSGDLGSLNITVVVTGPGGTTSDIVIVNIIDDTVPLLSHDNQLSFSYIPDTLRINFTATDDFPSTYEIQINNNVVDNGNWESGVAQSFDTVVDEGIYDIEITVSDTSGNEHTIAFTIVIQLPTDSGPEPIDSIEPSFLVMDYSYLIIFSIFIAVNIKRKTKK